jgi:hypothetical protein
MARAYGSSAHLLMKRETTYGQAAIGNYIRSPSTAAISAASTGPAWKARVAYRFFFTTPHRF